MPRGRPAAVAAIPTWSGRPLPPLPPPPGLPGPPVAARPSQSASSCPGRGNEPPGAAAPACRPAVWPASMFHFHPGVGQHAMGRPLFRLAGQDLRKRPAGTLPPRFPHLPRTPPNPPVRVHAACVLAPGPFGIGPPDLAGHRTGPARRATRPADRRPAPVRLRRLGQTARRIPERRPDVGSGQRRRRAARQLHPPSTPVKVQTGAGRARWRASRSSAIRSVAGGGTRDASPCTRTGGRLGKRWLRTTRSGFAIRASAARPTILSRGPARQPAAAKQMPPACRARTTRPVPHPAAGGTAPALGTMACRHRFPGPPVGVGDRIQPDLAEIRQRTGQVGVGPAVGRAGDPVTERRRRRRGQRNADTVGQSAGDAPGGAGARLSGDVMPTPASAQLADRRCPGTTAVNAGHPDHSTVSAGKCRSPVCMPCCLA